MNYFPKYEITNETDGYAIVTSYVRRLIDGTWYAFPIISKGVKLPDNSGLVNEHLCLCYMALTHNISGAEKEKYVDECQLTEQERLATPQIVGIKKL